MSASKFLLKSLLKQTRRPKKASGFTLLELLVALVLTFLIITPLMSLVISLMTTDRQEQAKNSSQQEIQAALDYMAQDLQQAVYIYDATGLSSTGILSKIPPATSTNGCTDTAKCLPVLAFWKRKYLDRSDKVKDPVTNNIVDISQIDDTSKGSDRFVYSLVVYYLIKDSSTTWSKVARVGRFEIRDGIKAPSGGGLASTPYLLNPDPGFAPFDLSAVQGDLRESMNSWQKDSGAYTQPVEILVDYIDDTTQAQLAGLPSDVQKQFIPPRDNECNTRTGGPDTTANLPGSSRVPPNTTLAQLNIGSFYACVNPINEQGQSVAQVYLRGNALPRLNTNLQTWQINAANQGTQLSYRPIANVRVAVRGLLGGNDSK